MGLIQISVSEDAKISCGVSNPGDTTSWASARNGSLPLSVSGSMTTTSGKGTASGWPYYFWINERTMLFFDLTGYSEPPSPFCYLDITKPYISSYYAADWANGGLYVVQDDKSILQAADVVTGEYGNFGGFSTPFGYVSGSVYSATPHTTGHYYIFLSPDFVTSHCNFGGSDLTPLLIRTKKDVENITSPLETTGETTFGISNPKLTFFMPNKNKIWIL